MQRLGGGDKSWKKESNAAIDSFLNNRPLRAKLAKGGPFDVKGGTINFGEFCHLWQQLSGRSAATQKTGERQPFGWEQQRSSHGAVASTASLVYSTGDLR